MGTGFSKRKKEAKALQSQFAQMQNKMQSAEAEGSAGNGLVKVVLSGQRELKQIKIKPECVDPEDIEGLEDLIKAAFKDALQKLEGEMGGGQETGGMPSLGGGMSLPPGFENLKNLF